MAKQTDPARALRKDETVTGGAYLVDGTWRDANGEALTREEVVSYKAYLAEKEAKLAAGLDVLPVEEMEVEETEDGETEAAAASARKRRQAVAKAKSAEKTAAKAKADETAQL